MIAAHPLSLDKQPTDCILTYYARTVCSLRNTNCILIFHCHCWKSISSSSNRPVRLLVRPPARRICNIAAFIGIIARAAVLYCAMPWRAETESFLVVHTVHTVVHRSHHSNTDTDVVSAAPKARTMSASPWIVKRRDQAITEWLLAIDTYNTMRQSVF